MRTQNNVEEFNLYKRLKKNNSLLKGAVTGICIFCVGIIQPAFSQSRSIPLEDLSSFSTSGKSWQVAGNVIADLKKENKLVSSKGTGILVNLPDRKNPGKDLFSDFEHGDMDLELDFMMAKGANSGIYLQGRYELQLEDSWGVTQPTAAHNGAVYQRWDESRPKGAKGYEGYPPRQNVSRAPGLWQHLKLSFQAPRFNENGEKIENARLLRAELNGVLIHENVELSGPTRGAISEEEAATGPLRLQGDHGAVAFRNIVVHNYDKPRPELKNLRYSIYEGRFESEPFYDSIPPEAEGPSVVLTANLSTKARQYLIRYTGTLHVEEAGEYTFNMQVPGGSGLIRINQEEVIPFSESRGKGIVQLAAGEQPFEMLYSKHSDWAQPGLGLHVSAPGLREYLISDKNASLEGAADPILVNAAEKPLLRSFMDLPEGPRVTHAISVGSQEQLHYTYDLDHGTLVQLWRGDYLDATPMWHDRGDGSSRPLGAVQHFTTDPKLCIARLSSAQADWIGDTTGTAFRPKGYNLDEQGLPTFRYQLYGAMVEDAIRVIDEGRGIRRELRLDKAPADLYLRLAEAASIEELSKGMYLIGGRSYYLRLDEAGAKPQLRSKAGRQELIIPLQEKISYSILY
jgi:hypothetical protein